MIPERETPNSPPRPEFCLFASETLSARIWAMLDEIQGVRESRDPECLHRMRVASRRFRNALSLFRECFSPAESKRWQKEARAVGRALGEARDADVQAASVEERMEALTEPRLKPGVERLLLRLSQKRSSLQGKVHKALERLETGPLKGELPEALRSLSVETRLACPGETAPVVRSAASVLLARRLAELEAFDAVADHPERVEELHSMRITAKRLRYTLEVFRAVLGEQAAAVLDDVRGLAHGGARRVDEERPGGEVQVPGPAQQRPGELRGQQVEVGAVTGHHRALTRVVDEHGNRPGEVGVVLHQVGHDPLPVEVLLGQLAEAVAADLADEVRLDPGAPGPHGHVRRAPARRQHHLAEGVTAAQEFGVGAD